MNETADKIRLISGRSNQELAQLISNQLGVPLTDCRIEDFANKEIRTEINTTVRGYHVYIIQTGASDAKHSINDHVMELLNLIYACKLSGAKSITALIPTYPFARSDKKDAPRVPITGALFTRMLETAGVNRIIAMDLHAGQIQGFTSIPFDNLYAKVLYVHHLRNILFKNMSTEEINQKYILCSPDAGGIKRTESYAKTLGMAFIIMHKHRDYSQSNVVLKSTLIGEEAVKDKTVILIDDMIDTFGTMVAASNELIKCGAVDIIILATHGIFSGPAIERLNSCASISKAIVVNTLPQLEHLKLTSKIEVVDCSKLIADAIKRLHYGGSMSELFE